MTEAGEVGALRAELAAALADVEHWVGIARKRHEDRLAAEASRDQMGAVLREARRLWGEPVCRAVEAGQDRHEVYTDDGTPAICCCGEADLLARIDLSLASGAPSGPGDRAEKEGEGEG